MANTPGRLGSQEYLAIRCVVAQPGSQVRDRSCGSEGPALATKALKTSGSDFALSRAYSDIDGDRPVRRSVFAVGGRCFLADGQGRVHGRDRVIRSCAALKKNHETVTGGFVNVPSSFPDVGEKQREIALHDLVELLRRKLLAQ